MIMFNLEFRHWVCAIKTFKRQAQQSLQHRTALQLYNLL